MSEHHDAEECRHALVGKVWAKRSEEGMDVQMKAQLEENLHKMLTKQLDKERWREKSEMCAFISDAGYH